MRTLSHYQEPGLQGRVWATSALPPRALLPLLGHETSANHLAFTVMELSRQPEIVARYKDLPSGLAKGFSDVFPRTTCPTCHGWTPPVDPVPLRPRASVLVSCPRGPALCFSPGEHVSSPLERGSLMWPPLYPIILPQPPPP